MVSESLENGRVEASQYGESEARTMAREMELPRIGEAVEV